MPASQVSLCAHGDAMSNEKARGDEDHSIDETSGDRPQENEVELRIPTKAEYLPVLRAVVGVIAGTASFNYDDILQLRVAVSEAFDLAVKHLGEGEQASEVSALTTRFVVEPNQIEISITEPRAPSTRGENTGDVESLALLDSLVDKVVLGEEPDGRRVIRMVKRRLVASAGQH